MKGSERARGPASGAPLRRLLGWAALAAVLAGGPFQDARAGCREALKPLREALAAHDLDGARRHYEALLQEFDCSVGTRAGYGLSVSSLHAAVAQERRAGGASLASQRALLERGLAYGEHWRTLALLGEAAHEEKEYARAAQRYQKALAAINSEEDTPRRPPDAVIERLLRLAWQSRMLGGGFAASPTDRSGEPDGLNAESIRGFKVEAVPIPITFETGKAEFDAKGRLYAEELARVLRRQRPARIVLSAHTDKRGGVDFNLVLSQRRGEAVRSFLEQELKEAAPVIEVVAKGESEPLKLVDPEHYGEQEVLRLNRRVELVRREAR